MGKVLIALAQVFRFKHNNLLELFIKVVHVLS